MAEEERKRQRGRYDLDRGIGGVCGECVFHHALAVESCWPFYAKEHIHTQSHASLPPDFISQTACRALGVTGCPFCLLMASGEERRGESRRWTSRHYCRLSQICTQKIFSYLLSRDSYPFLLSTLIHLSSSYPTYEWICGSRNVTKSSRCPPGRQTPQIPIRLSIRGMRWNKSDPWSPISQNIKTADTNQPQ